MILSDALYNPLPLQSPIDLGLAGHPDGFPPFGNLDRVGRRHEWSHTPEQPQ